MCESHPTTKIIVGIDFEPDGDLALDAALDMAASDPTAEIHVIFVRGSQHSSLPASTRTFRWLQRMDRRCAQRLAEAKRRWPAASFQRVVTHHRVGNAAEHIVRLAIDLDGDLIVVGTHNRKGLSRLMLGSVSEQVVHIATCPVQVVRHKDHGRQREVEPIEPRREFDAAAPSTH